MSPTTPQDPEKAALEMATTTTKETQPPTDYTQYSTRGLYGIFEATVREHPERGTEWELRLSLSAMELLMDLATAIALIIFIYYVYRLVADDYATNSQKLAPVSHAVKPLQCPCRSANPMGTNMWPSMP